MRTTRFGIAAAVAILIAGAAHAQRANMYGNNAGEWTKLTVDGSGNITAACTVSTVVEDAAETNGMALMAEGCVVRAGKTGSSATAGDNATCNVTTEGGMWGASDQVEDAAETAAAPLTMIGCVQRNTKASSAGTTGDNATCNVDANGGLWLAADIIEDVAETAAAPLIGVGTVRRDTAASSAGTTGDNATLNTDDVGAVWVHSIALGVEDAAETAGGSLDMAGAVVRAGKTGSTATAGDNATINVDANGGLWGASDQVEDAAEASGIPLAMAGSVRRDTQASSAGTTGDAATINTDATGNLWVVSAVLEDVAETAANPLLGVGAVRRDTAASSGGTDGDNVTLNTDATGHLWVQNDILTVAGTTAVVEDAAETAAGNLVPIATVRRDTKAGSAGTTGDNATLNTDANGGLWLAADVIEDAAETAAAPLVGVGTVRRDTLASSAGTTGDNATLNTDNLGALYVTESGHQAVVSGIITVTTAGTSVQGGTVTTKQCWFQTAAGATGTNCFLGAATGDNRNKGLMLIKGQPSIGPISVQNLNLVWADCATSGDTVQYFCTN